MATYGYRFPQIAYENHSREPARWREDGRFLDGSGVEVRTTDLNGVPGPLRTGNNGVIAPFRADVDAGVAAFGDAVATLVLSDDAILNRDRINELLAVAQRVVADANEALRRAVPVSYIFREPDGRVGISRTPVEVEPGVPVWEPDTGRLSFVFVAEPTP